MSKCKEIKAKLLIEKTDLEDKISKLKAFIDKDEKCDHGYLLMDQLSIMKQYVEILNKRINVLSNANQD
jgi:translation initiation factor IF-3